MSLQRDQRINKSNRSASDPISDHGHRRHARIENEHDSHGLTNDQLAASRPAASVPHEAFPEANSVPAEGPNPIANMYSHNGRSCSATSQVEEEIDGKQSLLGTRRKRDKARDMLRRLRPSTATMIGLALLGERVFELVANIN